MIFASNNENKFIFILTFASATPFLRPRDHLGGPDSRPSGWETQV